MLQFTTAKLSVSQFAVVLSPNNIATFCQQVATVGVRFCQNRRNSCCTECLLLVRSRRGKQKEEKGYQGLVTSSRIFYLAFHYCASSKTRRSLKNVSDINSIRNLAILPRQYALGTAKREKNDVCVWNCLVWRNPALGGKIKIRGNVGRDAIEFAAGHHHIHQGWSAPTTTASLLLAQLRLVSFSTSVYNELELLCPCFSTLSNSGDHVYH